MNPLSAIGALMHEHRAIERLLAVLQVQQDALARGDRVDASLLRQAAEFLHGFADECHHGKEEKILFRDLANKDMPSDLRQMMDGLIDDHVKARVVVKHLDDAAAAYGSGDDSRAADISEAVGKLLTMYPAHISTEDHRFFKPAIDLFTTDERTRMAEEFERFEETIPHERYLASLEQMERTAHTTPAAAR